VVAALSSVDVREDLPSFFWGYAPQCDPVGADAVQVPLFHAVKLGLTRNALCFSIVLGEGSTCEVVLELSDPTSGLGHQREEQAIS
jgi:hypothetical protein